MSKKKHYEVVDHVGLPCPRCGELSETRKHKAMTEKIRRQPYYYTVWFNCVNTRCHTTVFMSDDYKVWNKNLAAENFQKRQKELAEDQATLSFISKMS